MVASDTIFARASGAGKAGVAVFRVSGPMAHDTARIMTGEISEPRLMIWVRLQDPNSGHTLDEGLQVLFAAPASFTGEDVAEFHMHGSAAVETDLYEVFARMGLRPAEPGEFTRRAFANGKIDLARAEGLADLIDSETTQQRQQALGQLSGRLSKLAEGWRRRLIAIAAPLEADIDFPDEEDVPAAIALRATPAIEALLTELRESLSLADRARRVREGLSVVLYGAPNAGKSSLMNAFAGDQRAIVAATPGTTRDVIETRLDLGGLAVTLVDTAGLRDETADAIEGEGMRRARAALANADIKVLVRDTDDLVNGDMNAPETPDFIILNKVDINTYKEQYTTPTFMMSAKTGEGLDRFLAALTAMARDLSGAEKDIALTRARHGELVTDAAIALEKAQSRIAANPELAAEDLRLATRALGRITGAVGVDEVLDEIFSSFCIGK